MIDCVLFEHNGSRKLFDLITKSRQNACFNIL